MEWLKMGSEILAISGILMGIFGIVGSTIAYISAKNKEKIKKRVILADSLGVLAIIFGILALLI